VRSTQLGVPGAYDVRSLMRAILVAAR
jgi:hypothetical protein